MDGWMDRAEFIGSVSQHSTHDDDDDDDDDDDELLLWYG